MIVIFSLSQLARQTTLPPKFFNKPATTKPVTGGLLVSSALRCSLDILLSAQRHPRYLELEKSNSPSSLPGDLHQDHELERQPRVSPRGSHFKVTYFFHLDLPKPFQTLLFSNSSQVAKTNPLCAQGGQKDHQAVLRRCQLKVRVNVIFVTHNDHNDMP